MKEKCQTRYADITYWRQNEVVRRNAQKELNDRHDLRSCKRGEILQTVLQATFTHLKMTIKWIFSLTATGFQRL